MDEEFQDQRSSTRRRGKGRVWEEVGVHDDQIELERWLQQGKSELKCEQAFSPSSVCVRVGPAAELRE